MDALLNRPTRNDYFFGIAKTVSARSTCPSRQVGAVLVDPETDYIIATGYNGAARGTPHCDEACGTRVSGQDWEKCKAIHAELNVVICAAMNGARTKGSWLYLTTTPCVFCARVIINAGIAHVLAVSMYPHNEALELLASAGVKLTVESGVPLPILRYRESSNV